MADIAISNVKLTDLKLNSQTGELTGNCSFDVNGTAPLPFFKVDVQCAVELTFPGVPVICKITGSASLRGVGKRMTKNAKFSLKVVGTECVSIINGAAATGKIHYSIVIGYQTYRSSGTVSQTGDASVSS